MKKVMLRVGDCMPLHGRLWIPAINLPKNMGLGSVGVGDWQSMYGMLWMNVSAWTHTWDKTDANGLVYERITHDLNKCVVEFGYEE